MAAGVRNEDRIKPLPSQAELNRVLSYNPDTGMLFWNERPISDFKSKKDWCRWNNRYANQPALCSKNSSGYLCGGIFGVIYKAHRVIWKMVEGYDPLIIDHINGQKDDNRLGNLRSVTNAENLQNKLAYSNNVSGTAGVHWHSQNNRWRAVISRNGKKHHLGDFIAKEDARNARLNAEMSLTH